MKDMKRLANAIRVAAISSAAWSSGVGFAAAQTALPTITPKKAFTKDSLSGVLKDGIDYVLGIVAAIAVIMILYGGYLYITAGADDTKVGKAKTTLLYGVIGIMVAVLSYAIVSFANSLFFGWGS